METYGVDKWQVASVWHNKRIGMIELRDKNGDVDFVENSNIHDEGYWNKIR